MSVIIVRLLQRQEAIQRQLWVYSKRLLGMVLELSKFSEHDTHISNPTLVLAVVVSFH